MSEQDAAGVNRFLDGLDVERDQRAEANASRRSGAAQPAWEYMRWRVHDFHLNEAYLVSVNDVDVRDRTRRLGPELEQAGDAGWELVGVAPIGQGGVGVLFFKRPKNEHLQTRS